MIAAMGRQLKQSVKVFHNLILNLRLPGGTHQHALLEPNYVYVPLGFLCVNACWVSLFLLTLIVETVDAVDGSTLMVAPEQEKVLWVFDLVCQQKADGFQGLFPSVHIVTQEKVVCLWREATILKQPQQICVLPMDIT